MVSGAKAEAARRSALWRFHRLCFLGFHPDVVRIVFERAHLGVHRDVRPLALAAPFALVATLDAQSLEVQLQRAVQREAATGDHKAAIAEYRRIADRAGASRAIAAQALLRLADAHRDLGDAEAGKVYQRIVSGFADQTEVVAVAQTRLASSRTTASLGVAKRRVWFGTGAESKVAVSFLIGIYKALHILHSDALADEWIQRSNSNPIFAGETPLAYLVRGGLPAMQTVRRLLDSRRAG